MFLGEVEVQVLSLQPPSRPCFLCLLGTGLTLSWGSSGFVPPIPAEGGVMGKGSLSFPRLGRPGCVSGEIFQVSAWQIFLQEGHVSLERNGWIAVASTKDGWRLITWHDLVTEEVLLNIRFIFSWLLRISSLPCLLSSHLDFFFLILFFAFSSDFPCSAALPFKRCPLGALRSQVCPFANIAVCCESKSLAQWFLCGWTVPCVLASHAFKKKKKERVSWIQTLLPFTNA